MVILTRYLFRAPTLLSIAISLSFKIIKRSFGLDDNSEIYKGSKAIYNHAFNPETTPATDDLTEINYINDQNTSNYKKSKLEGLAILLDSLRDDVTSSYIDKFRKMFRQVVFLLPHAIYVTEEEDES